MQRDEPRPEEEPLSRASSLSPANVQRQQPNREETRLLQNSSRGLLSYPAILGFFAGKFLMNIYVNACWVREVGTNRVQSKCEGANNPGMQTHKIDFSCSYANHDNHDVSFL